MLLLAPLIANETDEAIELTNRVVIEINTASFRTTRGYSFAAVLADEVAFWRSDEGSANPDTEIMRALRPGLASIPGSMLLLASSPYAKKGELSNAYRRHHGRDGARVLVWKADTATMNPRIDPAIIREAYEDDPEAARAEYGAEFRDDLADFITREAIDAVTAWGRRELPPEPGVAYAAFCDPSGGANDAMTLAVAHQEGDIGVLDALVEIRPPFDPDQAVAECAAVLRRFSVSRVQGDRYAGQWPVARFAAHGIAFEQCARPKSDLYHDFLPLANARRIELLENSRLVAQLCGLERRTARSGKDSIDHTPGGHDDLANAVCGVLVGLDLDRRPALIKQTHLLENEKPVDPRAVYGVLGVLWVAPHGMCGWALVGCGGRIDVPTQYVLDYGSQPWDFALLDELARRLDDEAEGALAAFPAFGDRGNGVGVCMLVPSQLQGAANLALAKAFSKRSDRFDWHRRRIGADAIEDLSIQDITGTMLVATSMVGQGRVKMTTRAAEKAAGIPILGSLSIKPGEDILADPLRVALMISFALLEEQANLPEPNLGTARINFH